MPLEVPRIGDSDYQAILNDALARIRVHNPEWTNFNESDPGVTLLQLFAFMTESLLYRSNLIPERNRFKFLKLLGIPMQPATAAKGLVALSNDRGPLETTTIDRDLEVRAGQVPFRTEDAVDILPVEARLYYKRRLELEDAEKQALYEFAYAREPGEGRLVFYEPTVVEIPTDASNIPVFEFGADEVVGRSLWLAFLARPGDPVNMAREKIANKVLNLGIYPAEEDVSARTLHPVGSASAEGQPTLTFELATNTSRTDGTPEPRYERLRPEVEGDMLAGPSIAKLRLPGVASLESWQFEVGDENIGRDDFPPPLEETADKERLITWMRIRPGKTAANGGLNIRLSWLGMNATRVIQRAHVAAENLGQGSGEPDQLMTLTNTPVIPRSMRVTIGGEEWEEIDDLTNAGPEVQVRGHRAWPIQGPGHSSGITQSDSVRQRPSKVFVVDRESGELRFGDGARGARPPLGSTILASYDYGGGRQGNVNVGEINKGPALPPGIRVLNWMPTWGGDEAETPAEAEKNITKVLQHRNRLVTREDFQDIIGRTPGVDIGRVEVLPHFNAELEDSMAPGIVTVMIIPRYDEVHPEAPQPDTQMLDLVCEHIEPRRLVSTEVQLRGPSYVPMVVSVGIQVQAGRDFPPVREAVNSALRRFLSPVKGGRQETGWPLETNVVLQELWAEAARVSGVAYVTGLLLGDADGTAVEDHIAMLGLQLPQLLRVDARLGDPESLDSLVTGLAVPEAGVEPGEPQPEVIPVPVVPPEC